MLRKGIGKRFMDDNKQDNGRDGYEHVCMMCHRPESVCGKLFHMPPGLDICEDCLQKSFDLMNATSNKDETADPSKPIGNLRII